MYIHANRRPHLALLVALITGVAIRAQNAENDLDFLEEPQARAQFDVADFTTKFEEVAANTPGGDIHPFFVKQAPALATLPGEGVSQALVTLKPCAINQPHSHPRGTEFAFLTKGSLRFAFLEENPSYGVGGRLIGSNLTAGHTIVIPQGLIHWALNNDCKQDAQFISSFPTRDPGIQTTLRSLFSAAVPDDVLRATTGLDNDTITKIRDAIASPAASNPSFDAECLKRCYIDAPDYSKPVAQDEYPPAPVGAVPYGRRR